MVFRPSQIHAPAVGRRLAAAALALACAGGPGCAPPRDGAATVTAAAGGELAAPRGNPPVLDGTLSPGEWNGATRARLSGGGDVYLMQAGGELYLGLHGASQPVVSVFIERGDQIAVLHSSAALGTATYKPVGEDYARTRDFAWTCREAADTAEAQAEREGHLRDERWLATTGPMGRPGDTEFRIAMPAGALRIALAAIGEPGFASISCWPAGLRDDCRKAELLQGSAPARARFAPAAWITVTAAP